MTIEEAQARILELETENDSLKNENNSLSQNNNELTQNLDKARELNQKLFERVNQKETDTKDEEDEEDVPTCEEFAKTIKF